MRIDIIEGGGRPEIDDDQVGLVGGDVAALRTHMEIHDLAAETPHAQSMSEFVAQNIATQEHRLEQDLISMMISFLIIKKYPELSSRR